MLLEDEADRREVAAAAGDADRGGEAPPDVADRAQRADEPGLGGGRGRGAQRSSDVAGRIA